MYYKSFYWIVGLILLIVAVFAYNIPAEGATLHTEAVTVVAPTLLTTVTPQSTATEVSIRTVVVSSSTPTSQPPIAASPTSNYSVPMLTLRDATNCRTGPGLAYEVIVTYPIGQTLEILGRLDSDNFWLVKSSESSTGTCWLWGEFAEVAGSTWTAAAVTFVTPPPTPTTAAPLFAPTLQKYDYECDDFNGMLSFLVTWEDRSGSEAGYRIFRDGWLIAELPAGSTSYSETIFMPVSRSAEYSIQAYNATASASLTVAREKVTCDS